MKKINLSLFILPLLVIFLSACQKQLDSKDGKGNAAVSKAGNNANLENRCRLLSNNGLSDGFLQAYHYNTDGLADEMHLSKPGEFSYRATMSYGSRNEITNARFYYDAATFYDIVFEYEKDKIITETWYEPGTNIAVDGYINSYNARGQLVKRDEPLYEVYCLFHYDAANNPVKIEFFDYGNNLVYGVGFSYSRPVKNPFRSVTGLPESIFFTEAIEGPNRFTGLKYYFPDPKKLVTPIILATGERRL